MITNTETERGLLRAVRAEPADDTPRLALADHWEECGRGEAAAALREHVELCRGPFRRHDYALQKWGFMGERLRELVWHDERLYPEPVISFGRPRVCVFTPRPRGRVALHLGNDVMGVWNTYCLHRGLVETAAVWMSWATPGLWQALAEHPVRRVRFPDRQPARLLGTWLWYGDPFGTLPPGEDAAQMAGERAWLAAGVARVMWDNLYPRGVTFDDRVIFEFPRHRDARLALSDAGVLHLRRAAGDLPPRDEAGQGLPHPGGQEPEPVV